MFASFKSNVFMFICDILTGFDFFNFI